MKKLASVFLFIITLVLPTLCQAQSTVRCRFGDALSFSSSPLQPLGICNFTAGATGSIYAVANAEVQCTGTETVQMFIGSGSSPVAGSNFTGSVSGGVLTVTRIVNGFGNGGVNTLTFAPGASGTAGTYNAVTMTGSSTGTGFTPNVVVAGGVVTQVQTIGGFGVGYTVGDVLTPISPPVGFPTGFSVTVTSVLSGNPWLILPGQTLTGAGFSAQNATIINQASTTGMPAGQTGMLGTYNITNNTMTGSDSNAFTLPAIPGTAIAITSAMNQNGCNPNFVLTGIAAAYTGVANAPYWLGLTIKSDVDGNVAKWNNNSIVVMTY